MEDIFLNTHFPYEICGKYFLQFFQIPTYCSENPFY